MKINNTKTAYDLLSELARVRNILYKNVAFENSLEPITADIPNVALGIVTLTAKYKRSGRSRDRHYIPTITYKLNGKAVSKKEMQRLICEIA